MITGLKDVSRAARRRHADHRSRTARPTPLPGLQGRQADGLRRPLPDRLRRLPRAARRAREAEAERRRAVLRAGDVAGARLRLPLRLPRACCTWRSCASGSSASSTSTCSSTAPNVAYRVRAINDDEWIEVHTPSDLPDSFEEVEEPYIKASIIVPKEFVGAVMELNNDRRGTFDHLEYLSPRSACTSSTSCRSARSCSTTTTS